jgi:putative ABC transport system ATP-binding protein
VNEPCAVLSGVSVNYGDGTSVELPNLELFAGDQVALRGPSGSGKTTLLHVLSGLIRPSAGVAQVGGLDLRTASPTHLETHRAKTIGLMFQDFHLLEGFTALEQVTVALGLVGMTISNATTQARTLLERVQLSHRLHSTPNRLSTGERQRVALARALASKPKLLLVDEPTAHLDPLRGQIALGLLRENAREIGAALLIATHDPVVLEAMPNQISFKPLITASSLSPSLQPRAVLM